MFWGGLLSGGAGVWRVLEPDPAWVVVRKLEWFISERGTKGINKDYGREGIEPLTCHMQSGRDYRCATPPC